MDDPTWGSVAVVIVAGRSSCSVWVEPLRRKELERCDKLFEVTAKIVHQAKGGLDRTTRGAWSV